MDFVAVRLLMVGYEEYSSGKKQGLIQTSVCHVCMDHQAYCWKEAVFPKTI